jgi:hypothetical protein
MQKPTVIFTVVLFGSDTRTDKKAKKIFLINWEIQTGAVAKSYMTNALSFMTKYCAFLHILGSPSSYVTLQPIPSEFP